MPDKETQELEKSAKTISIDKKDDGQRQPENNSIDQDFGDLSIAETNRSKVPAKLSREEKYAIQVEADRRSIFVGNITSDVTPETIEEHFARCGEIKRITLLHDKHTGVPKGYAYVQFESPEVQQEALELNGTELKGNKITVYKKRTNLPGYHKFVQYQRPNFYYPNQWTYTYNAVPNFKDMNFYPPYSVRPDKQENFNQLNYPYRSGYRNNYRGSKRGNSSRNFREKNNRFQQHRQMQENDQQQQLIGNPEQSPEVAISDNSRKAKSPNENTMLNGKAKLLDDNSAITS